jgi:hypothetical protein
MRSAEEMARDVRDLYSCLRDDRTMALLGARSSESKEDRCWYGGMADADERVLDYLEMRFAADLGTTGRPTDEEVGA